MSKLYAYDATKTLAIARLSTSKLARMSDIVANTPAYITGSGSSLTLAADVIIAVGDSIFKSSQTTLTASNNDGSFSSFSVGSDYCIYCCDPTEGDDTDYTSEVYLISLNTSYPNGYTADNSRKIGGFHYGVVRNVNSAYIPINPSGTARGTDWESNVSNGILPNSIWTLLRKPTCDPTGMVRLPNGLWSDIYLASDNGNNGFKSEYNVTPMTGSEGLNWYIANERAHHVGKRLPDYGEFCIIADGSPEGRDANNTYAWSATSNSGRKSTGYVNYAVSSYNVRDCVGNVWKWLNEYCLDPTASSWGWQDVLGSGYGDAYIPSNTALHAFIAGGNWSYGVHDGSRSVGCYNYPWNVDSTVGALCVCDE